MSKLLSTRQLATHLDLSEETVRRWARAGKIPSERPTQLDPFRFRLTDVQRALRWKAAVEDVAAAQRDLLVALHKLAYDPEESVEGRQWAMQTLAAIAAGDSVALRAISAS